MAAREGHRDVMDVLIAGGADPTLKNSSENTAVDEHN